MAYVSGTGKDMSAARRSSAAASSFPQLKISFIAASLPMVEVVMISSVKKAEKVTTNSLPEVARVMTVSNKKVEKVMTSFALMVEKVMTVSSKKVDVEATGSR